ncbi:hypothetical protein WJX84_004010 [Apatococcus fuscideae]|uniref:HRDC domain-containing protein n=1 Tax=Apatococcus fuscideae TaxID=2026836 RepID=A0AAW1SSA5_9CHLO
MKQLRSLGRACSRAEQAVLPSGPDFYYHSGFRGFFQPVGQIQEQLKGLITKFQEPGHEHGPDWSSTQAAYEWATSMLDKHLDAVDSSLSLIGRPTPPALDGSQNNAPQASASPILVNSRGRKRSFSELQAGSVDGPRPQDAFPAPPDNSNQPFQPTIHPFLEGKLGRMDSETVSGSSPCLEALQEVPSGVDKRAKLQATSDKLHAHIQALGLASQSKRAGQPRTAVGHPLGAVLENLQYQEWQLSTLTPRKPKSLEVTPLTYIDTLPALQEAAKRLAKADELAVDLEHHGFRSFQGFTCLMQMSTREEDIIIDTLALRAHVGPTLGPMFANPQVVKVLHGSDSDIHWLQRDFGIYIANLFDTGQAARVLGLQGFGLAFLLQKYCNVKADKQYQLADWRVRPLAPELLHYARSDTHYLLYIYDCMKAELVASETSYLDLYQRLATPLPPQQLAVFAGLFAWRDKKAREADESTGYVVSRTLLLSLSSLMPSTALELRAMLGGRSPVVGRHAEEVVRGQAATGTGNMDAVLDPSAADRGGAGSAAAMMNTWAQDSNARVLTDGQPAAKKSKAAVRVQRAQRSAFGSGIGACNTQAASTPQQSAAAIMEMLALPFTFAPSSTPTAAARVLDAEPGAAIDGEPMASPGMEAGGDGPQQADAASVRSVVEQLKAGAGHDGDAAQPPGASPSPADDPGPAMLLSEASDFLPMPMGGNSSRGQAQGASLDGRQKTRKMVNPWAVGGEDGEPRSGGGGFGRRGAGQRGRGERHGGGGGGVSRNRSMPKAGNKSMNF